MAVQDQGRFRDRRTLSRPIQKGQDAFAREARFRVQNVVTQDEDAFCTLMGRFSVLSKWVGRFRVKRTLSRPPQKFLGSYKVWTLSGR